MVRTNNISIIFTFTKQMFAPTCKVVLVDETEFTADKRADFLFKESELSKCVNTRSLCPWTDIPTGSARSSLVVYCSKDCWFCSQRAVGCRGNNPHGSKLTWFLLSSAAVRERDLLHPALHALPGASLPFQERRCVFIVGEPVKVMFP